MNNSIGIMVAAVLVMAMPATAYTIDGNCNDWGIHPTDDPSNHDRLNDNSLIPASGISYVIENDNADWALSSKWVEDGCNYDDNGNLSNFTGPEWCDIEAMYVDDDSEYIYVLIITSMPKLGKNWPNSWSTHYQPGDLALDFNGDGTFEYGVKIVKNDPDSENGDFGVVGAIYSNLTKNDWAVLDSGSDRIDITNIVGGIPVGGATIKYTGPSGSSDRVPDGPDNSELPGDTFGPMVYGSNPVIPNEVIEIAIPKSALNLPRNTVDIQSSISCGNGVIKLKSVSLVPEFVTLAIPVISLLGLVFYMRRKERK